MPDVSTQSRPDYMGVTRIKPARNDGTAVTATAAGGSSCGGGGLASGGRRGAIEGFSLLEGPVSDRLSIDGYHPRRLDGLDLANSRRFLPCFVVSSPHMR